MPVMMLFLSDLLHKAIFICKVCIIYIALRIVDRDSAWNSTKPSSDAAITAPLANSMCMSLITICYCNKVISLMAGSEPPLSTITSGL